MRNKHLLTIWILVVAAMLTGCDHQMVFSHYEHVPQEGWEKNDTLFFTVPPVKEAGTYEQVIGIRTDIDYPFQSLALVVAQDIFPSGTHLKTTKECVLYDESGKERGKGVSRFQYEVFLQDIKLNQGDSLRIYVTHNMRREIMSGVSDIGIILKKK